MPRRNAFTRCCRRGRPQPCCIGRLRPSLWRRRWPWDNPASAWRMTPVAGSFHSTRSMRFAAASRAVADDHHAGVLRVTHADAAAVMQRHPRRAAGGVEQRVQQRPVGDRIGAVQHRFGLAIGRRDAAGVEMVAADDDRRLQLAACHHLVEREARRRCRSPSPSQQMRAGKPWNAMRSRAMSSQRCRCASSGKSSLTLRSVL